MTRNCKLCQIQIYGKRIHSFQELSTVKSFWARKYRIINTLKMSLNSAYLTKYDNINNVHCPTINSAPQPPKNDQVNKYALFVQHYVASFEISSSNKGGKTRRKKLLNASRWTKWEETAIEHGIMAKTIFLDVWHEGRKNDRSRMREIRSQTW